MDTSNEMRSVMYKSRDEDKYIDRAMHPVRILFCWCEYAFVKDEFEEASNEDGGKQREGDSIFCSTW